MKNIKRENQTENRQTSRGRRGGGRERKKTSGSVQPSPGRCSRRCFFPKWNTYCMFSGCRQCPGSCPAHLKRPARLHQDAKSRKSNAHFISPETVVGRSTSGVCTHARTRTNTPIFFLLFFSSWREVKNPDETV